MGAGMAANSALQLREVLGVGGVFRDTITVFDDRFLRISGPADARVVSWLIPPLIFSLSVVGNAILIRFTGAFSATLQARLREIKDGTTVEQPAKFIARSDKPKVSSRRFQ